MANLSQRQYITDKGFSLGDNHDIEITKLNCDEFYGHDDRCNENRAYFCDHASWRFDFFTQWMNDFQQFR